MIDIIELQYEIRQMVSDKGWRENIPANPRDNSQPFSEYVFAGYIALAHSELTEALEAYRDKDWSSTREDGKPLGVGPEIADAFIRILDMCDIWNINIEYELDRVIKYGHTRPYKHGGRTL